MNSNVGRDYNTIVYVGHKAGKVLAILELSLWKRESILCVLILNRK